MKAEKHRISYEPHLKVGAVDNTLKKKVSKVRGVVYQFEREDIRYL